MALQFLPRLIRNSDLASGDIIDVSLSTEGMTWNSTAVSLASNATFVDYLDEAAAGTADADTGTETDEVLVRWFQFNGNTYMVTDRDDAPTGSDASGFGAADSVLEIEGLFDLSTASLNATTGQFTIA